MTELDLRKSEWNDGLGVPAEFLRQHLLVIAAAIRNAMDQNPARADYGLEGMDTTVGDLVRNTETPTATPLSLREGCNKILHCLSINVDYATEPARRGGTLNADVHRYGEKDGKEWKASLSLMKFVEVAFQLA
jgi:hypothetical protein